ncbi:hypothetical protein [Tistrella mobilis]
MPRINRQTTDVDQPPKAGDEKRAGDEKGAFDRLKAALTEAFAAPDMACQSLTAAEVIARNRR